jgi:hypothetical protein
VYYHIPCVSTSQWRRFMVEDSELQNLSLHNSLSQAQKTLVLGKVSAAHDEEQPAKAPKQALSKKQKAVERQKRFLNHKHATFEEKEKTLSQILGVDGDEDMEVVSESSSESSEDN